MPKLKNTLQVDLKGVSNNWIYMKDQICEYQ